MNNYSVDVRINHFAIRSFRDTADRDYIHARLAYQARLIPQFLWSSLHCLEKYAKCILLLNRIDGTNIRHEVLEAIFRLENKGSFQVNLSKAVQDFIGRLESGAEFRYFEVSYCSQEHDILRLDCAVSELRRYCQTLDYDIEINGGMENQLEKNLKIIRDKLSSNIKDTCISNGWLETVMANKKHPAREPLLWNNLYFGSSRRKRIRMIPFWESGNAPLYMDPEILNEVVKYVFLPKTVKKAYQDEFSGHNSG